MEIVKKNGDRITCTVEEYNKMGKEEMPNVINPEKKKGYVMTEAHKKAIKKGIRKRLEKKKEGKRGAWNKYELKILKKHKGNMKTLKKLLPDRTSKAIERRKAKL